MPSPRETVLCHYRYDPLDLLISQALPDIPERQRFYCKSRLATEIQGAMRYSIVQHGDQLLAQQRSEGDAPDTTLLVTDQQRSVLQVLEANHSRQPIAYSPYGFRSVENGLLSLLGFNGERPDSVTGCYLLGNGYRAFNPVLMRFNSPDSWSPFGKGGLNTYAYCLGNPINNSDQSGRFTTAVFNFILKNRRIHFYGTNGRGIKILPGVSTRQAMQARDKILRINKKLGDLRNLKMDEFKKMYENGFPPSQPSSLQRLAEESVISNNILKNDVPFPSGLRGPISNRVTASRLHRGAVIFIQEHVKNNFFGYRNLKKLANGGAALRSYEMEYYPRVIEIANETKRSFSDIRSIRQELKASKRKLMRENFDEWAW